MSTKNFGGAFILGLFCAFCTKKELLMKQKALFSAFILQLPSNQLRGIVGLAIQSDGYRQTSRYL
ncbi:MAG: hypothetical protein ATN35_09960 [Epulopiscium sp. Nele67-Bin004]|nr:MAG: hypothetical protein ATN35_09960 [Epulopiscium sp. Nele67-Bin004]